MHCTTFYNIRLSNVNKARWYFFYIQSHFGDHTKVKVNLTKHHNCKEYIFTGCQTLVALYQTRIKYQATLFGG